MVLNWQDGLCTALWTQLASSAYSCCACCSVCFQAFATNVPRIIWQWSLVVFQWWLTSVIWFWTLYVCIAQKWKQLILKQRNTSLITFASQNYQVTLSWIVFLNFCGDEVASLCEWVQCHFNKRIEADETCKDLSLCWQLDNWFIH